MRGPKYGCGINVCKACTSHVNGKAFNTCSVPVSKITESDEVTTIEGLPDTVGQDLHPMQEAWIERDVAQCGYRQPGQIMAAVAVVNRARAEGRRGQRGRPRRHPEHLPVRHLRADPGGCPRGCLADVSH